MMHLEFNLEKIARTGRQKEEENFDFRSFLKGQDSDEVDQVVHRLHHEIASQIDCRQCGNCCKWLRPCVTRQEIETLSGIDHISSNDFVAQFIEEDDEGIIFLKDMPCKYLKGTVCSIYVHRPEDCKSYPHTHKPGFTSRTLSVIDNYEICPIVFNLFERLKEELNYKYRNW
ncbi:MAG: YkgJ family cysteine cluster protein [Bacteroidales bacterium]